MRCLKRRLSDAVYKQLVRDASAMAGVDPGSPQDEIGEAIGTGPGGQSGASQESSAADLPPHIGTSDQPLPDPQSRRYAEPTQRRKTTVRKNLQTTG
jgi:hypothetical protein